MARNTTVVADAAFRFVAEVAREVTHARVELLEHDGLGLDVTNLFCDDPVFLIVST